MKKLTLLFTAFLLALPAHAADITLNSRCTLADAIIAANSDRAEGGCPAGRGADTITLSQDITLGGALPAITSEITIEGGGYTISGDKRYRIFYNDGGALTINDLTMTKGRVEGEMIINADRSLKNTTANPIGGAIVNWKGTLAISGSRFIRNSAEQGGAIYNAGELNISGSSLNYNSAEVSSGGQGGAVFNADGGELIIINSSFSVNRAYEYGGAIFNDEEATLSITSSSFTDNGGASNGGAVLNAYGGELSIASSSFTDNWAEYRGGAIYSRGGKLSITSASFSDNRAYGNEGGAIVNWGELSITSSSFTNNASADGGAISNRGELNIASASFSGNAARGQGGAVVNVEKLSISDSSFTNNSASDGGAIANFEELSAINSAFSGNSADWEGGAVYNWAGELSISASSFSGNSARGASEAFFNGYKGKARIINSAFSANSYGNDGSYGLAVGETGTVYLRNVIIASHLEEYPCYSGSGGLFIHDSYSHALQGDSYARAPQGDLRLGALVVSEDGSKPYYPILVDCLETD